MNWPAEKLLKAIAETEADCLTIAAMAEASDMDRRKVFNRCDVLRRRKFIEHVRTDCYRITALGRGIVERGGRIRSGPARGATAGKRPVDRKTLRAKVWTALRQLEKGTAGDMLALAKTGTERDALNNARKYLQVLCRAGYVTPLKTREPGTAPTSAGFVRYLLVKNTGPLPPVYHPSEDVVRDPNIGEEIELAEAS